MFQGQVVSRRQGEFEKLLREREERLAEMRLSRHLDCERRRKMEYYRQQEEARLLKIKEEEEARKREGNLLLCTVLFAPSPEGLCYARTNNVSSFPGRIQFERMVLLVVVFA